MLNISPDYWKQYMLTSDNPHQLSPGSPIGSYTSSPPKSPATPEFKPGSYCVYTSAQKNKSWKLVSHLYIKFFKWEHYYTIIVSCPTIMYVTNQLLVL